MAGFSIVPRHQSSLVVKYLVSSSKTSLKCESFPQSQMVYPGSNDPTLPAGFA